MNSLRFKLTLRFLVGGMVLLGIAALVFEWSMRVALTRDFDSSLSLTLETLRPFVEEENGKVRMDSDVKEMPEFNQSKGSAVHFLLVDGVEVSRSKSLGNSRVFVSLPADQTSASFDARLGDGRKFRFLARALPTVEGQRPVLVVGRYQKPLEHTLENLGESLMTAACASLAMLAALVWWSVRGGLRPLNRLVVEIDAVKAESLGTRFASTPLPAELRPIAERLNELLARLEAAFAREKRFTANVAHELRTPLAELRALAEVSLMAPADTPEESAACWRDVKDVSGHMEALALRLLELARAENPALAIQRSEVNPAALLDQIWKRHAARAAERGITLQQGIPESLVLESDPVLLEMALSNLCGNAVQHAPEHSLLRVAADEHTIRFLNPAPALSPNDLPHLFERFWRKDASRTDRRHHGLGLALAAETAVLLGGRLEARLTGQGELEMSIHLP
ncbi:ATP-binding protein [Luteolibacter sp. LG18]|uniref:ATP-binding protein n=1 Tax=Luteolibacter sp. LG18 TaxID=2819286 RepID=UPI002B2F415C|nr:two-component sensor histidine kinase [Luteolibacter sp. LG18]